MKKTATLSALLAASLLAGSAGAAPAPTPTASQSFLVKLFGMFAGPGGSGATPAPSKPAPTAPTAPAAAPTASAVVDAVQKFYAGTQHVTAKFQQTVTNETFGDTKTSSGVVWIAKPGKMRWDYYKKNTSKVDKSFISDGSKLWVVEHSNKQVIKKSLDTDLMPVAVSFLYGKGDLKTDFDAALDSSGTYGGKGDIVLKLTPKKPSAQYKNLYLVVAPSNFRVTQSIIVDSSDNVNHFKFFEPDFEKAVKDAWFKFDPSSVPTYKVIDADKEGADKGDK